MANAVEIESACALLETDVLRHIVALKMIRLYGNGVAIDLRKSESDWALVVRMPDGLAPWDRITYGSTLVAILDGSGPRPQKEILDTIRERPVLVKTSDAAVVRVLEKRGAELKASFVCLSGTVPTARPPVSSGVERFSEINEESIRLFANNGYNAVTLAGFFADGAQWFGVRENDRLASACFVYRNYGKVWEIAGVYTEPCFRGRGLAKKTVSSAIEFLVSQNRTPRYDVKCDNLASLAVARACDLVEFLKFNHYLWKPSAGTDRPNASARSIK